MVNIYIQCIGWVRKKLMQKGILDKLYTFCYDNCWFCYLSLRIGVVNIYSALGGSEIHAKKKVTSLCVLFIVFVHRNAINMCFVLRLLPKSLKIKKKTFRGYIAIKSQVAGLLVSLVLSSSHIYHSLHIRAICLQLLPLLFRSVHS